MHDYSLIQNAFLEGINEVFTIMFSDRVLFYFLDEKNTVIDKVYRETEKRVYCEPYSLVAKVQLNFTKEELPDQSMQVDCIVTVPALQLISNGFEREDLRDLKTLAKGKFEFKESCNYEVIKVLPKTLVADEWQFYVFYCRKPK